MAIKGSIRGLCGEGMVCILDLINVNSLVVTLCYSFARCYHGVAGNWIGVHWIFCILFYNFM